MSFELYALAFGNEQHLCPDCANEKYPDGDYPEEATPVFESDNWKHEIQGKCAGEGCSKFIGE